MCQQFQVSVLGGIEITNRQKEFEVNVSENPSASADIILDTEITEDIESISQIRISTKSN